MDGSDVRGDAAPGLDAGTTEPTASDHSRERRLTHAWLTNDPTGILFGMKRVLGPVEACMDRYLVAGGLKWKRGQDITETSACGHAERQSCKKFLVCMPESGEPFGDSIDQLSLLMSNSTGWQSLPARFWQTPVRTRICLMWSQAACGLRSLEDERLGYPLKLFGIPRDRALAPLVVAESDAHPCLLDSFFSGFHAPPSGWRNGERVECLCELLALTGAMEQDTSSVEASHTSGHSTVGANAHREHCGWIGRMGTLHANLLGQPRSISVDGVCGVGHRGPGGRAVKMRGRMRMERAGRRAGRQGAMEIGRAKPKTPPPESQLSAEVGGRARGAKRDGCSERPFWRFIFLACQGVLDKRQPPDCPTKVLHPSCHLKATASRAPFQGPPAEPQWSDRPPEWTT